MLPITFWLEYLKRLNKEIEKNVTFAGLSVFEC